MKLTFLALAATLAITPLAQAQSIPDSGQVMPPQVYDRSNALHGPGYCQITVTTTATSIATLLAGGTGGTCSVPSYARSAMLWPEASGNPAIRCGPDSTVPTSALGTPIAGGYYGTPRPVAGFSTTSCISATGASVTVDIEWRG